MTSEREIEKALVTAVKQKGGICPKFVSPGFAGVPDRLVLMPKGRAAFVEVKKTGEKPRPLQEYRHKQLKALGFKVYVLDDIKNIKQILKEVMQNEAP